MPGGKERILFVVNRFSGRNTEEVDRREIIEGLIRHLPHEVSFYMLPVPANEEILSDEIKTCSPSRVIAVGGDGTVALVAKILMGTDIPLGIIPAGSANGLARELRISADFNHAMQTALSGKQLPVDLVRINESDVCLHLSDIGLNAHVIKFFHDRNFRGMLGYGFALAKALMYKKPLKIKILLPGEPSIETSAIMVIIANARKYGSGATVNPKGNIHDGIFEIILIREIAFTEILKMFLGFKKFNPEKIELYHTTSATITIERKAHFQVDGEYRGQLDTVRAEIIPAALKLMVPD